MANLSAVLLVGFCLLAMLAAVSTAVWGVRHPLVRYPFDARWVVFTGLWSIGLVALLFAGRARAATAVAWGIVALVAAAVALLGSMLWSMLAAIWIVLLATAWGDVLLRSLLAPRPLTWQDRVALGAPMGLAVLGIVFFALALLQALAFWSVNGVLLLLTIGILWIWRRDKFPALPAALPTRVGRLEAFVLGAAALFLLGGLFLAVAPETRWDGLIYQLAVPEQWVQHGGVVADPWNFRSYWFGNVTMMWAAGLLVAGQPTPQLIHLLTAGVLVVQAYAAGTRLLGRNEGWVAALLVATTPIVQEIAGSTYTDVIAAVFTFAAVYVAIIWFEERQAGWLLVFGVLAGAALSTKLNAIFPLAPAILLVVATALWEHRRSRPGTLRPLALSVASIAVLSLPFLALRWAWTGNPVFPVLNDVFRSPLWPPTNERLDWDEFGAGAGPLALLRLPWEITTNTPLFGRDLSPGVAGALFLLALPLFLLVSPRARRPMVVAFTLVMVAGLILWFLATPYLRYAVGFFPGLAVLAAGNLVCAYQLLARTRLASALGAIALVAGGTYLWASAASAALSHWEFQQRYPVSLAFGLQTSERYLSQQLAFYRAYQWLNDQDDRDLRVIGIGTPFGLYLDGRIFEENGEAGLPVDPLLSLPRDDPGALARALRKAKIDYLVVANNAGTEGGYIPRNPLFIDRERFLGVEVQQTYSDDSYSVYSVDRPSEEQSRASRAEGDRARADRPRRSQRAN